ncbi:MAG: Flp pilus assembly complex ATPase component TadA [Burkholderiales bacterium]|nr:Flp pilus assembly complex ATPase component TadA [Burkholderiales bacterium]
MSDLSSPPLSLVPLEDASAPAAGGATAFAWPTPPFACYPAPQRLSEPEACQIEGMNGRLMNGLLIEMDLAEGVAKVRIPPARIAIPLRFNQFRRLTLTRPLAPLDDGEGAGSFMAQRPAIGVKVHLKGAAPLDGLSIGHREEASGLFLFPPVDARGSVLRCFIPKAAYDQADIGERIGELLVAQKSATPEQVEQALAEQQQLRSQKLGDILLTRQIVTPEELEKAILEQSRMPMVRIGEALIALGFIDQAQLDDALSQQRGDRSMPLGELLVRRGLVSRADLQTALARKMGYPLVDVGQFPSEAEALSRLPYAVALRVPALPLLMRGGRLIVAVEDPSRPELLDDVEFAAQTKVVPVLARAGLLAGAVQRAYERIGIGNGAGHADGSGAAKGEFDADDAGKLLATLEQQQAPDLSEREDQTIEQSDNSLVRLINSMIAEAQSQGVSDIHIECQPGRDKVKIRFRKDGSLRPYMELPHTYRNALIARIKIMCDLDISERRKPQDGKINFGKFVPGQRLELRVATIPTANGLEDAVLRLLASAKPIPIDNLGLSPENLGHIKAAAQRPYGMMLCVGPTGSGKTTTLHSVLGYINQPDRKIWTAEDPVEITQAGMRQVQVNPKIDWTFAKALRAFLRADPDVIMVGEIRDRETAQMAVEASLTGHLVMSTLHTNSAVETVTRLLDMGMDPFNFADSLLAVLAQRLVRRLCSKCVQAQPATPEQVDELMADYLHAFGQSEKKPNPDDVLAGWKQRFGKDGKLMHHYAKGCPSCDGSGLRGRAGLHELLVVSREIRHLIQTGARPDELLRTALSEGLRTLRQDGIDKVWAGVSTIEEVRASSNS